MSAVINRCVVCRKSQADYEREGAAWAAANDAGGFGVPGIRIRAGAAVCDFCAREISEAFASERKHARPQGSLERPTITPEQRWTVWERDDYTCRKCGARRPLAVDHVVPLCLGGEHHERNMQTLCTPCNRSKGGRI